MAPLPLPPASKEAPLDMLDRALLYWLDRDSRASIPALARRVHASPSRVRYRIRQLVDMGRIQQFVAVIDYRQLGGRAYTMHYKLREIGQLQLEKLMHQFAHDPNVADIMVGEGTWDLQIAFLALDMDEAGEVMWRLREKLGPRILEEKLTVHLRSQIYARESLLGKEANAPAKPLRVLDIHRKPLDLDEHDHQLLTVLAQHAEWPVWKLAEASGLSGAAAWARIKRLERVGMILGYSILTDPNLPGFFHYRVYVKLHYIPPKKRDELERYLQQLPQVFRSTFCFGDFDLYYELHAAGGSERRAVMSQVYERFGKEVIRQDWMRVNSILKFTYFLPPVKLKNEHGI